MELWESFPFTKAKGVHKFLVFGSKSSKLRTNGKDNSNKKVKSVVNVHVCNDIYMWFWCFGRSNSFIFNKMNSEFSGEWFIVFFPFSKCRMGVQWYDKGIKFMMIFCERFVCKPDFFCWQLLSEGIKYGIQTFLNIKKFVAFGGNGRWLFGKLWCMWRFSGDLRSGHWIRSAERFSYEE